MGTRPPSLGLSAALFGRTRRILLALFYGHPDESYYLRQISRRAGLGMGAVQREVRRLSEAGIIHRTLHGQQTFYQANRDCPVFAELKGLVVKTAGAGDVLRAALAPLAGEIKAALIYGSLARGAERAGSDIDVLVVGQVSFEDIASALHPAQKTLAREVNPTVYAPAEFTAKLAAGDHFLTSVVRGEKIFLMGDERELARMGAKRVVHHASKQR